LLLGTNLLAATNISIALLLSLPSISSNNSTWTKVGTIENAVEKNGTSDFIFLVPVKAQYIKI